MPALQAAVWSLLVEHPGLLAAGLMLALWIWCRWDAARNPGRPAPRRWYQSASLPTADPTPGAWDLEQLDREYADERPVTGRAGPGGGLRGPRAAPGGRGRGSPG